MTKKSTRPVKIDIIAGFLGAGKTTLINKLLREAYFGEKIAVLENEFGSIGIDGDLIAGEGVEVREMTGGCICCSLRTTLIGGLIEVCERFRPDRILIEPTGLADIDDIARPIEEAAKTWPLRIERVLTVVNAKNFIPLLRASRGLLEAQIQETDLIILSRVDESDVAAVTAAIAELRDDVAVVAESWSRLNGLTLLTLADRAHAAGAHGREHIREHDHDGEHDHEEHHCGKHGHEEHHHHSADAYDYYSVETDKVFSGAELATIKERLTATAAARAKGLLATADGGVRLDYVDGDFTATPSPRPAPGKFVVIAKALDKTAWETLLQP